MEAICSVYDSFLLEFPLCHEYWVKYVAYKARLCTIDKLVDIYERAVQSATYCVSIWVEYCSFGILAYEDPSDVRRLFKRAMSFVGKDYLCHPLWDKYFEFEFSQQQWTFLAQIYVQALKFPTKNLHRYYDNFKKFVDILEEEMKQHANSDDLEMEYVLDGAVITSKDEISSLIDNLLHPSSGSFRTYIFIGERYYRNASELEKKIDCFETNIRRHSFDATPVDDDQLENWRQYLDFVEKQGDFDWAVKLYERCLIPCADYLEFWMRYVEYAESKGGRELAKSVLDRATRVFVKNSPEFHFFNAQFKELIGNKIESQSSIIWPDSESSLDFVEKIVREANWEKRSGNFEAASTVYEIALEIAAERQKLHEVAVLYVHFARLKYIMTGKRDEARDVITQGLRHLPYCKLLLEGLINFSMMHGEREQIDVVDNLVADAITQRSDASQGLSDEDCQYISNLYLQFVDLCGTIHDIRKAWSRHFRLFPHLLRPSSSYKLRKPDNELMVMIEQRLSYLKNHALLANENKSTENHVQSEEDNNNTKENLRELCAESADFHKEDTCQLNQITHDSVHKPTNDLALEGVDDAEQGQKCISLVALSLKNQEMECGDLITPENCSNANGSPLRAPQESSQDVIPNQTQNEQLVHSPLANHENHVPEPADMDTHISTFQGVTQGNTVANHAQGLQKQNAVPILQSQPSAVPAFHPQAQIPQFRMPSGDNFGINQPYNQAMWYYYQQQQQLMLQQHYLQQQQYMQQVQQQQNTFQPQDQHGLSAQQQQQLSMLYQQQLYQQYQQQQQQNEQRHRQQITPTQTPTWDKSNYQQGQQVMTQVASSSSGVPEPPHAPKQTP